MFVLGSRRESVVRARLVFHQRQLLYEIERAVNQQRCITEGSLKQAYAAVQAYLMNGIVIGVHVPEAEVGGVVGHVAVTVMLGLFGFRRTS
jgi:hypothetical protein